MSIRNRAKVLKLWMEYELRDPDSYAAERYKLFRIFPNIHHLQYPRLQLQRRRIYGTSQALSLSKFWEKKSQ